MPHQVLRPRFSAVFPRSRRPPRRAAWSAHTPPPPAQEGGGNEAGGIRQRPAPRRPPCPHGSTRGRPATRRQPGHLQVLAASPSGRTRASACSPCAECPAPGGGPAAPARPAGRGLPPGAARRAPPGPGRRQAPPAHQDLRGPGYLDSLHRRITSSQPPPATVRRLDATVRARAYAASGRSQRLERGLSGPGQRPLHAVPDPLRQHRHRRRQPGHHPVRRSSATFPGSTTCPRRRPPPLRSRRSLPAPPPPPPEPGLALHAEHVRDRGARRGGHDFVEIHEAPARRSATSSPTVLLPAPIIPPARAWPLEPGEARPVRLRRPGEVRHGVAAEHAHHLGGQHPRHHPFGHHGGGGTAQVSERWRRPRAGSLVTTSTLAAGCASEDRGFIAARSRRACRCSCALDAPGASVSRAQPPSP